ncbi:hypothetical protein ScPMuIL_004367 [Solemya velum]
MGDYSFEAHNSAVWLTLITDNMPSRTKVFIKYGPYEACGVVEHRISRLKGLQNVLTKDGHTVELVEIEDWNRVELIVNGEQVFTCDIRDLDYGCDGGLDTLCKKASDAVRRAY